MEQQLDCRPVALFTRCSSADIAPWQFMTRLGRFNASDGYVCPVIGAVLFVSLFSDAEHLGDVNTAIELGLRTADEARFRK